MVNIEEKTQQFIESCRTKGLHVTSPRLAIYRDIVATDTHPTAEEVYDRVHQHFPAVSLATVYKTFETFEKHGFISKVFSYGRKARYDGNQEMHHHLICKECGKITDISSDKLNRLNLPGEVKSEFEMQEYRVDFYGLCKSCSPAS